MSSDYHFDREIEERLLKIESSGTFTKENGARLCELYKELVPYGPNPDIKTHEEWVHLELLQFELDNMFRLFGKFIFETVYKEDE